MLSLEETTDEWEEETLAWLLVLWLGRLRVTDVLVVLIVDGLVELVFLDDGLIA